MYFPKQKLPTVLVVPNQPNHKKLTIKRARKTKYHSFCKTVPTALLVIQRICWAVAMVTSFLISICLIANFYEKWISSPVIVAFANSETAIDQIPFPAVTVCPEVKSNMSLFNYTDIYLKLKLNRTVTSEEKKHFNYMSLICQTPEELLNDNEQILDEEALDDILKVSPLFEEFAYGIQWTNNIVPDFSPVLTDEGLCYTFNMIDRVELFTDIVKYPEDCFSTNNGLVSCWSPDAGYPPNLKVNSYPHRSPSAGTAGGLIFALQSLREQFDYVCRNGQQGYKIALHQPAEFPLVKENYFRVSPDSAVIAAIKPNVKTTSSDMKDYKAQDRKCYFSSEKKLKFFRIYTEQNCLLECLTNVTLNMCGCVSFYMPREKSTRICAAANKKCLTHAKRLGYTEECDCLPSCYSIKFEVETSATNSHLKELVSLAFQLGKIHDEVYLQYVSDRLRTAEVTLFFKDMLFVTSERNILYGTEDFWASIGGVMGLCMGFSFLSLCEILYFITLRIFYNTKAYGCRRWAGPTEQLGDPNVMFP